jgi:hypothetical protein
MINYCFLIKTCTIFILDLLEGRLSYRRSSSPEKRTKNVSKPRIFSHFVDLWIICPSESGSSFPTMIRIKPIKINTDPCGSGSSGLKSIRIRIHNIGNYCNLIWLYYYFRRELQETQFRDPSLQSKNLRTFVSRASCNIFQSK